MKNIAIVITRMIPGGASQIVTQIIEAAAGRYNLTLITGKEDLDSNILEKFSGRCKVVLIPSLVRNISPFKDFCAYREILCELRKSRFDVVHTHTSKAGFLGRLAAVKAGVPVIIHSPHGSIYTERNNIEGMPQLSFGKKILQMAEKHVGKKTTWLTTLSEHEKKICIDRGLSREDNSIVVHNGIDVNKFAVNKKEKKEAKESMGISSNDIVLVSVGRLSSEKGHSVLIDAFAKIRNQKSEVRSQESEEKNLRLIIVGDGPEKEALIKQAEEVGLSVSSNWLSENEKPGIPEPQASSIKHQVSNIIFTGHCDDIKPYLAASNIFVLPSFYEGFGIAVVEAMAAGLPVIATNVGGLPEILTDGTDGLLFSPGNDKGLAEKIKLLLNSPRKREEIARKGLERSNQFTTEKMLEKYFALYE